MWVIRLSKKKKIKSKKVPSQETEDLHFSLYSQAENWGSEQTLDCTIFSN